MYLKKEIYFFVSKKTPKSLIFKMKEKDTITIVLLKNFFNKKCSKKEQKIVVNWFECVAYEQKLSAVLKKHWNEIEFQHKDLNEATERVLHKIHHQINLKKYKEKQQRLLFKKIAFYYVKIAAVLFFPIFLYTLYLTQQKINKVTNIVIGQQMATAKILSPLGARTFFTLPDGSTGWLNSGSTLKFPVKFIGKERKLELVGEAWFDVVKKPKNPFIVKTSNINVIALGTKFNVQAYLKDKYVRVTLESGKIVIKKTVNKKIQQVATLFPGDQVKIFKENTIIQKREKVNIKKVTSWKKGILVIRNEKMSNLIKRLERWYNVTIEIKDKAIEKYVYRATFQDETIDEVLKYLKLTSPIDYKIKKRKTTEDNIISKREIVLFLN